MTLLCGAMIFYRFATNQLIALRGLWLAFGKMTASFVGLLWWLFLLAGTVAAIVCVFWCAHYFLNKFVTLVQEGTELRKFVANKTEELESILSRDTERLVASVDRRIEKIENRLDKALSAVRVEPERNEQKAQEIVRDDYEEPNGEDDDEELESSSNAQDEATGDDSSMVAALPPDEPPKPMSTF